jgi:Calcineurin-like phosphoesterase
MKLNKYRSFSQIGIVAAILLLFATDSRLKDGPYVLYKDNKAEALYINNNTIETKNIDGLSAATDLDEVRFPIVLKKELPIEAAVYPMPEKLLSLSDIEGNFEAFRKLLQSAEVIDDKFNWTFGMGHLVFCGDMFDRGEQVTECLWLVYTLEEKAKTAGGYVHFILGNHEIMNLNGDIRYVREKYLTNAKLLNSTYQQLFDGNSELGRWLRTKNIMEKIGDIIFLHGGISREVNRLKLTIEQINNTARPWYDKENSSQVSKDQTLDILSGNNSPFWYRGYYMDSGKVKMEDVNTTLALYNAHHIVTGHTIVSDTVSVHFDGKIINTDTHHAGGKSEALLVEADSYYRVNAKGDKVLLLKGQRTAQ